MLSPFPPSLKMNHTPIKMKTSGYQAIPEEAEGEQPMELSRQESSNNSSGSDDGDGSNAKRNMLMVALSLFLLCVAYSAGRSSSTSGGIGGGISNGKGKLSILPQDVNIQNEIPSRLCEVYYDPHQASRDVTVIQTSRAEPSRSPILGFGGAFTEAAALNYMSLNEEGREMVMQLLFGREGLGYSLGRTHINSCDFCIKSYSFDDTPDDFSLSSFDTLVSHDLNVGMVDMMLLATKTYTESHPKEIEQHHTMRIIASPWSPPSWMKAPTESDVKGADGVGEDSKYAKAWALFFSKFIDAYANHGIDFFGVTVQNEPEFPAPWDACAFDAKSQRDFIANHLGPRLAKSNPNTKLLIFDHNKDHMVDWARALLEEDNPAAKYIDGTAFHWYAGMPNMHRMVSELDTMKVDKSHILLGSEACHCPTTGYAGGDLDIAWARAMRNAHTVLADMASGSNGFIEWNLILDSIGGPNHLGNMCDSPLLALNAEGVSAKYLDVGIVVQPMYYYMGHITRFVRPGSRAIHALVDSSIGSPEARTFRPKGQTVAGGGINDLARIGIEVTLWPCEGSTRQEWTYNSDNQLQVFGHDWLGVPTTSCLAEKSDKDMGGLMLTTCNVTESKAGLYDVIPVDDKSDRVNIVMKKSKVDAKKSCLVVQPLRNNGGAYGPRGGGQINVGDCSHSWAEWTFDTTTGEISSMAFEEVGGEVCVTTGWPFLQVGAFDTSSTGDKANAVVVLNEAGEAANFILRNDGVEIMSSSIPPHSIQTISFN
ncbi:glucosylceramidase [Thalassiosira pseudonana CCMP1335]